MVRQRGLWAACGPVGGLWAVSGGAERAASGGDGGVVGARLDRAVLAVQEALKSGSGGLGGAKFSPRALRAAKICVARSARDR